MIRLFAGIATGGLVLAALCLEIVAGGYYFSWIYTIHNGSVQVGYGLAGTVAIAGILAATLIGGVALTAKAADTY